MGLLKGDIEKVPKSLTLKEYYDRIYRWHLKNRSKTSSMRYLELVESLPVPNEAALEDIVFVCKEVIAGFMEWAYHEVDDYGIKTAAYAHYVLDTFSDGFGGKKTEVLIKKSRLYGKFRMSRAP